MHTCLFWLDPVAYAFGFRYEAFLPLAGFHSFPPPRTFANECLVISRVIFLFNMGALNHNAGSGSMAVIPRHTSARFPWIRVVPGSIPLWMGMLLILGR